MKSIKALAANNQPIWVIVPDISLLSYIKSHDINYLDIFYAFGQFGINKKGEIYPFFITLYNTK